MVNTSGGDEYHSDALPPRIRYPGKNHYHSGYVESRDEAEPKGDFRYLLPTGSPGKYGAAAVVAVRDEDCVTVTSVEWTK